MVAMILSSPPLQFGQCCVSMSSTRCLGLASTDTARMLEIERLGLAQMS
jgi:hypothetical protein